MRAKSMFLDQRKQRTTNDTGFTLIEVLVSLLIAAAAMMAISTLLIMSNLNSSKSRQMTSALSLAQGLADSLRSVRAQDVAAVPWNMDQLTDLDGAAAEPPGSPSGSSKFLLDSTNPNAAYQRYYRLECPPGGGVTRLGSVQVTVRVIPVRSGAMLGTGGRAGFAGVAYGSGERGRGTDMIFYMQDPTMNMVAGTGGINGGVACP